MCILFLFSTVALAATDLIDGHHRRFLQDYDDVHGEDHHYQMSEILKKFHILIVVLIVVALLFVFFCIHRSREDEHRSREVERRTREIERCLYSCTQYCSSTSLIIL